MRLNFKNSDSIFLRKSFSTQVQIIKDFFKKIELENHKNNFQIELKYVDGEPVIKEISRISTPGRRVYSKIGDLQRNFDGLGISILSTSKGVLSDSEARDENVGGEILCKVF